MLHKTCVDCGADLKGHGNPARCRSCAARQRYFAIHGQPAPRLVANCETCGLQFSDYASNRQKGERFFCSPECRAAFVGIHNSVTRGGDGQRRTKSEKDALYYRSGDNAKRVRLNARRYYSRNRDDLAAKRRAIKQQVIDGYGGACACCGETRFEFLTIDHKNNDGAEHRKRVGKDRVYKDLIAANFPTDSYQLLCFNCNASRGFYGYCPHRPDECRPQLTATSSGRTQRVA